MNIVEQFVSNLTDEEKIQILQGWEEFSKAGFIGEEPLRKRARTLLQMVGQTDEFHIVMWMREISFECFRYFAMKHVKI